MWTSEDGDEIGRSEITDVRVSYDDEPPAEGESYAVGVDFGDGKGDRAATVVVRVPTGWIGVDFDGTLAKRARWPDLGEPIPAMLERVKAWVAAGVEVRIVSVRAGEGHGDRVQDWLERHGLPRLIVTDKKDHRMFQLWDDRAVRVETDTGRILGPDPEPHAKLRRS